MKRDFDLLREILLLIEERVAYDDNWTEWPELIEKGYKNKDVFYHLILLSDSKYIVLDQPDTVYARPVFC